VLGFAALPEEEIARAVGKLTQAVASYLPSTRHLPTDHFC
jgi:hypothetical protein